MQETGGNDVNFWHLAVSSIAFKIIRESDTIPLGAVEDAPCFQTPVTILFSWYEKICDLPDEQIEQQLNELSNTNPLLVAELRSLLTKESQPGSPEVLASIEIAGSEQRPTSGRQVVMPGTFEI